ncbi:MAG: mannose-1-phosphate guanylyltransferase [Pirellulales bacterium]|nr:mannose-1-phosphate guanylyltransferase [Pirellulales bacterium]
MSRSEVPKQLIPFLNGQSLLEVAYERVEGLVPIEGRYICAAERHRDVIASVVSSMTSAQFIGEPVPRDTLAAVGLSAAVIATSDPEAVIGVFTSDHLIEPVEEFQRIIATGFTVAEQNPNALVTFGIAPSRPATSFGYLELGATFSSTARAVESFYEKPKQKVAEDYCQQGPTRFLWNSGIFVWRAKTLLDCIRRYEPETYAGLQEMAAAWNTPAQADVVERVFPTLKKTSIDYAIMEPASRDDQVQVVAIPMDLDWLDVGSWPIFAQTRPRDAHGNAIAAEKVMLQETTGCLVASSDPEHLIATIGCEDLVVIHTESATLVCRSDQAEQIKALHQDIHKRFHGKYT